uniref:RHD domain-containing protein n=1 Tax=Neolamprologus brichardi TaxID=32507 RepID=A0A3Q4G743_NEOBR
MYVNGKLKCINKGPGQSSGRPKLMIVEEPRKRGRFRYECAGILGVSSTKTRHTGPTIEIQGGISPSCLLTNTPTHIYTPRSFTHRLGGYQVI